MVTIFYGEDQLASRAALLKLCGSYEKDSVIEFAGETEAELALLTEGLNLFSSRRLVIVELPFATAVKSIAYLSYLSKKPETSHVAFWVGEDLSETSSLLKEARRNRWEIMKFDSFNRKAVFNFIDEIFSRDRKRAFTALTEILRSDENLFGLFSLVIRRARFILWVKLGVSSLNGLRGFEKNKVMRAAGLFREGEAVSFFDLCARIDRQTKTGLLEPSLGLTELTDALC